MGARDLVEHAVDILVPLVGTEQLGQLDCLVDGDAIRNGVGEEDLERTQTQDRELHRIDLADRSIEDSVELRIDLGHMDRNARKQLIQKLHVEVEPLLGIRRCVVVLDPVQRAGDRIEPLGVIEEMAFDLHRVFAGQPPLIERQGGIAA